MPRKKIKEISTYEHMNTEEPQNTQAIEAPDDSEDSDDNDPFVSLVRSMEAGERLLLKRVGPTTLPHSLKGYLETFTIPHGSDSSDILELIQRRWGGGDFSIQRCSRPGTVSRFQSGGAWVSISGPPLHQGKKVNERTGEIDIPEPREDSHVRILQNMLPSMTQPAPVHQNPDAGVVSALTSALVAIRNSGQQLGIADILTIVRELQGVGNQNTQRQPTPISELRQHVQFLSELRGLTEPEEAPAREESELPRSVEDAFMQFFKNPGALGQMFSPPSSAPQAPAPQAPAPQAPAPQAPALPTQGPSGCLWDPRSQSWIEVEDDCDEDELSPQEIAKIIRKMTSEEKVEWMRKIQDELSPSVVEGGADAPMDKTGEIS